MSGTPEDARLALANMHSLALATLRAKESAVCRKHLEALADYAPDPEELAPNDPRSDEALAAGITPIARARRFAARVRGAMLGAAAHPDAVSREVSALAHAAVEDEGVAEKDLGKRALAAWERSRTDLESDIVRLASSVAPPADDGDGAWVRRWGAVRALELNAFVATFTRDGTDDAATDATRKGRDAAALRFALAVAQAAMSVAPDATPDASLLADVRRADAAVPALLATMIASVREAF